VALDSEILRSSFDFVVSREPELTLRFYEILFARYPQAQPLFGRNSRANQAQMLQGALMAVMDHLEDANWLQSTLTAMGKKHVDYGVTDEMYDWVGSSLLATLAEIAGPAWTPKLEAAWTDAYGAIAGLMKAGASQANAAE
jgi:hemoglobin-like flavoprotein